MAGMCGSKCPIGWLKQEAESQKQSRELHWEYCKAPKSKPRSVP